MKLARLFKPGSLAWLLVVESLVALRQLGSLKRRRGDDGSHASLIVLLLWQLLFVLFAILSRHGQLPDRAYQQLQVQLGAPFAFFMGLMGFIYATQTLLQAAQWRQYLAAPMPFARAVSLRCLQLAVMLSLIAGVFLFPAANAAALTGHFRLLSLYPLVFAFSLAVVSVVILLLSALVMSVGRKHARSAAMSLMLVLPLLLGWLAWRGQARTDAAAEQLGRHARDLSLQRFSDWLDAHPLADFFAGALLGEPWPLLLLTFIALLMLQLSSRLVQPIALQIASTPETPPALTRPSASARPRFGQDWRWLMLLKEWRSLFRDWQRLLGFVASAIAVAFGVVNLLRQASPAVVVAVNLVTLAIMLTAQILPLLLSGEESPMLLASAPRERRHYLLLKCAAAMIPACALTLPALLWLAWVQPSAALASGLGMLLGSGSIALVLVCRPYRVERRAFMSSGWPEGLSLADVLAGLFLQIGWPLACYWLLTGVWWAALILAALVLISLWGWWQDRDSEAILGY